MVEPFAGAAQSCDLYLFHYIVTNIMSRQCSESIFVNEMQPKVVALAITRHKGYHFSNFFQSANGWQITIHQTRQRKGGDHVGQLSVH